MKTADRRAHRDCMRRWAEAETVADLGELGALWLEGEIPSQPGYERMCGPDEETTHLVPVLARLNRAGFFTNGSQPGVLDRLCQQRAAVEGFVADPLVLARILCASPKLRCIVHDGASWWRNDYRPGLPVTRVCWAECTHFGVRLSRRYLRFLYGETGALDALYGAWQVTIVDEVWGRDDALWPTLDRALGR